MISAQVNELRETQKYHSQKHEHFEREYVTHRHLDAVIAPLQKMMDEIRRDIKELLMLVTKNGSP